MSEKTLPENKPLRIAQSYRMQWEDAQDCHVLLFPEGMIKLNASASEILGLCDGRLNGVEIIAALRRKFPGAELEQDVREFLSAAHANGWICTA
jgi:pyrroloquinoline quinone biosynthesis protein D